MKRETPRVERANPYTKDVLLEAYGHKVRVDKSDTVLVRIDAPSFYQDPEFLRWLNDERFGPATWHRPRGSEPDDHSDIFIYYGGARWSTDENGEDELLGEGSDYLGLDAVGRKEMPEIPPHIYAVIAEAVKEATGSYYTCCVVWIANLER